MSVPILRQGAFLIATLQGSLRDADLEQMRGALAEEIGRLLTRGVLVDVSAVDVLDSFATRMLRDIAQTTRLRGAEMVIVGIQPDVAFTMVQLGLTLENIKTALDFEEGLALLSAKPNQEPDVGD